MRVLIYAYTYWFVCIWNSAMCEPHITYIVHCRKLPLKILYQGQLIKQTLIRIRRKMFNRSHGESSMNSKRSTQRASTSFFTKKTAHKCVPFSVQKRLCSLTTFRYLLKYHYNRLVPRKQPRLSPTVCESLRMRPKALGACVWDGRKGIHREEGKKTILNAYVLIAPTTILIRLSDWFFLVVGVPNHKDLCT